MSRISRATFVALAASFALFTGACTDGSSDDLTTHQSSLSESKATATLADPTTGDGCFEDGLGGPTSCKSTATWKEYAHKACLQAGMELSAFETSKACGKGLYRYVDFKCCPPGEVCCKTSSGPQTLPASECKPQFVLPDLYCEAGDVCCKTASGPQTLPATECPPAHVIPDPFCSVGDVCCKTPDGYQTLPAAECPIGYQVADQLCEEPADVCCKMQDGTVAVVSAADCQYPVPDKYCAQEVCCETAAGYMTVPASECPAGAQVPPQLCEEPTEVCCKHGGAYVILPSNECPDSQIVPDALCSDEEVCCETATGIAIVPASQCPTGAQLPLDLCDPTPIEVCCKLDDGTYAITSSADCPATQIVPDPLCTDEDVCCETAAGYMIVPASQCPNAVVPMALCEGEPEDVCCKLDDGTYGIVPAGDCATPVADHLCEEDCVELCCKTDDGYQILPADECPQSQVVAWAECQDEPCDEAITGQCEGFDYTDQCNPTGFDCTDFAILGDTDCDGLYDVCIECPPGTVPTDSNGDGCEDMCDCCEPILCPLGWKPVDTDGDGCDDECSKPCLSIACPAPLVGIDTDGDGCDDTCVDEPCDEAISGQCDGFDYSDQCDPTGLDCGTAGILGDLDCDGLYEVCLECPPGTFPHDSNGDGCEDICDCCEPILCPVNGTPVDTDGDGCPDDCKVLCDYAILCPVGTTPTDTDGDGCDDECVPNCPLIACQVGLTPFDADGDGCDDTCIELPCDEAISGQCKEFDYTDQCDPTGLDCGSNAILGDTDCDGKYDVCQLCPPGTHPWDSNGDGCEDMCNCCQPFLCPAGTEHVDTDEDGCEDACVGAAGDTWKAKTCGQLGGTWVQTVTGEWACQVGMGAPCNCGQVCDGAVLTGAMCPN